MSPLLGLAIAIVFLVSPGFGQRTITKEEYSSAYFEVLEKTELRGRRKISRTYRYRDGSKALSRERIEEYLLPYKAHILDIDYGKNIPGRVEFIDVDGDSFCRHDSRPWERVSYPCIFGPRVTGVLGIISSSFSVEEGLFAGSKVRVFREYTTYKPPNPRPEQKVSLSFNEIKLWVNERGLAVYKTDVVGLIEPRILYAETIDEFEYDPKGLKIEPPIK